MRFNSERTVSPFGPCGFGLSTALQVFTGVFATLWVPSHGIRLLRFLDYWVGSCLLGAGNQLGSPVLIMAVVWLLCLYLVDSCLTTTDCLLLASFAAAL